MNILHHKSWHIRNKRNIEQVRRDEEKHAAKQNYLNEKAAKAEKERLYNKLRGKTDSSNADDPVNSLLPSSKSKNNEDQAINLERQKELEEQNENLKYKLGMIQNLGQTDLKRSKPLWYNQHPKEKFDREAQYEHEERCLNKRLFNDPLGDIPKSSLNYRDEPGGRKRLVPDAEKYGDKTGGKSSNSAKFEPKPIRLPTDSDSDSSSDSDSYRKAKKRKKKAKKAKKEQKRKAKEEKQAKLEKLRAERLKREKKAREQAEYLRSSSSKKSSLF